MGASVKLLDTLAILRKAGFTPAELVGVVENRAAPSRKRRFSAATRRKMALAQKARWAKARKTTAA